jgi:hypothetical protein
MDLALLDIYRDGFKRQACIGQLQHASEIQSR